ncbi:MAG: hypothetical protein WCV93_01220 [Candidatus Shapirobacteria bacterium]|jgi:hypothetical protein
MKRREFLVRGGTVAAAAAALFAIGATPGGAQAAPVGPQGGDGSDRRPDAFGGVPATVAPRVRAIGPERTQGGDGGVESAMTGLGEMVDASNVEGLEDMVWGNRIVYQEMELEFATLPWGGSEGVGYARNIAPGSNPNLLYRLTTDNHAFVSEGMPIPAIYNGVLCVVTLTRFVDSREGRITFSEYTGHHGFAYRPMVGVYNVDTLDEFGVSGNGETLDTRFSYLNGAFGTPMFDVNRPCAPPEVVPMVIEFHDGVFDPMKSLYDRSKCNSLFVPLGVRQ